MERYKKTTKIEQLEDGNLVNISMIFCFTVLLGKNKITDVC